jgi:hypothetical protein
MHNRVCSVLSISLVAALFCGAAGQEAAKKLDPAGWGADHVGKRMPEFVHGDECLFCHRNDIGPGWQRNAHGVTLRQREDAPETMAIVAAQPALAAVAQEIQFVLGSRHRVRFLKKQGYGKLALLETQAVLGPERKLQSWIAAGSSAWDSEIFGASCVGCHASEVDSSARTFAVFGLDCLTCHGAVPLEHSSNTSLVWLSKKRRRDAAAVMSICAQCHVRTGAKSRASGLPYANNFVAGDNLFKDYEVDFSKADDPALNPGDRHVLRNIRDVVVSGSDETTCLTCHQVHAGTSRHRAAVRSQLCLECHNADGPMKETKSYTVRSALCQY